MNPDLENSLNRRGFLRTSGAMLGAAFRVSRLPMLGAAGLAAASASANAAVWPVKRRSLVRKGDVILFQGDSITDMGRSREKASQANNQEALGNGYAWLAAAELLVERPKDGLTIYNRGISGNKVFQLADRWQTDCLDLKPSLLSVLIGVNDLWHTLNGNYNGTVEIYEHDYNALLDRTKKALPQVKVVICEPFVLRCGAVNDKWFPAFDEYRAAAKRVAERHHAVFIPFQTMFDQAIQYAPPNHWAADGVHPTSSGASLMAYNWLRAVDGR